MVFLLLLFPSMFQLIASVPSNTPLPQYEPASNPKNPFLGNKPKITECMFNVDCPESLFCCRTAFCCDITEYQNHMKECSHSTVHVCGYTNLICCATDQKCHFPHDCPDDKNYIKTIAGKWQSHYKHLLEVETVDDALTHEAVLHEQKLLHIVLTLLIMCLLVGLTGLISWCIYRFKTRYDRNKSGYDYMGVLDGGNQQTPNFSYTPYQFSTAEDGVDD